MTLKNMEFGNQPLVKAQNFICYFLVLLPIIRPIPYSKFLVGCYIAICVLGLILELTGKFKIKQVGLIFLTLLLCVSVSCFAVFSFKNYQELSANGFFNNLPQISQSSFGNILFQLLILVVLSSQIYCYIKWLKTDYFTKVKTPSGDGAG